MVSVMKRPKNGIYIIQGEISLVVTAMRRSARWGQHNHQDEEGDPLLKSFSKLKDLLNSVSDLGEIEPNVFLSPFLEVIRSEDTTGPITGLALTSVKKLISYGLLDPSLDTAAAAIENIADAVTHARFVGTDPGSDEVVLMKILYVLGALLLSPAGILLTNESVCEIMQSCFRICFEMRLSELLRKSAEHTLMDMVQLLFTRLPQFKEDPKWVANMKKLKMRAGGVDQARMGRKKRSPKPRQKRTKTPADSNNVPASQTDSNVSTEANQPTLTEETTDGIDSHTDGVAYVTASRERLATTPATPGDDEVVDICKKFQEAAEKEIKQMQEAENQEEETFNPESSIQGPSLTDSTDQGVPVVLSLPQGEEMMKSSSETDLYQGNDRLNVLNPDLCDDSESIHSTTDLSETASQDDFINSQGVRFMPHSHNKEGSGPLIPYGLPCVRELFRFLISLTNPLDRHNTDVMIHMGLSLLAVAFESGADHIGQYESLLFLVKDEMCRHLFLLLQSERLSLFSASVRVCFLVFESIRSHLKFQLEMYLTKLADIIVSESPRIMYETREIALDAIVQLFKIPGMVTELFINYDCDLYCSNLFEDTTKLLSKNAFPVQGLFSTHLLSLDALLTIIDCIEPHCYSRILAKQKSDSSGNKDAQVQETEGNTDNSNTQKQDSKPVKDGTLKRGQSLRQNRMKVSDKVPTQQEITAIKHKKKIYYEGTKQFNVKPSKGIQYLQEQGYLKTPLDPDEVVVFLKENPRLDKAMIGEYVSKKTNGEVLRAFVTSFHFEDLRVDEALRLYLESFRLPGEAPVIAYLIEHFSEHWSKSNGEPFHNYDAAFTLTYAIIMLNVDQHNHNAKKQNIPMTNFEFKKNLNKCNGGEDFDQDMLEEIYNAIRNDEIVMPSEHTGLVKENYLWKVLLRRGGTKDGHFIHAPPGSFDHELFTLTWGSTVAALSFVFDKSSEEAIIQKAITGFRKCAMIAAQYEMSDVFDNLVISLCKFTTLLSAHENPESISISFGSNMKAKLAAQNVFSLTHRHGDILREGWKNILDCMMQLFRAKLLPKPLIEAEDFIDEFGKISIIKEDNTIAQKSEGGLASLFSFYFASDNTTAKGPTPEEQEAIRSAQDCIEDCNLENLITDSRFLREISLQELVKALVVASQGPEAHVSSETAFDEDAAVFFLEFLIKVVLQNRDRVNLIWENVRDHLYNLVVNANEHTFLVERAVVGLLRLAIRLLRRDEVASTVLTSLRILLMIKPCVIHSITRHIAYGLHDLLRTNAANIHTSQDWYTLFTLLEVVGAGADPPPLLQVCSGVEMPEALTDAGAQSDSEINSVSTSEACTDRGYVSDGELYDAQSKANRCPSPLEVRPIPENGSWLLVNSKEKEKEASGPRKTSLTNQYTIELNEELHYCDSKSLLKSSETLSFLVRDAAHITPLNFESCVHSIRAFVETSLNGGRQRIIYPERKVKGSKAQYKKSKQNKMKKSNSSPSRLHQHQQTSEEEDEQENTAAGIHSLSIQLLDLMHTLHTRAASIYKSWAEEEQVQDPTESIDAGSNALWVKCWCPLLQGIARLCCDTRRQVRSQALTYLQRALLVHDLQTLSAAEWESCFNKVLFPLLTKLLENINIQDPTGMEETRMRASTLLCKVFLQHLTPLLSLSTFTALWLTILEFMDKYMHADNSDLLAEAIPESLKNMLLVMDTAGIFQTSDGAESQLWKLSWDRIDTFLPTLRQDLFKPSAKEVKHSQPTLVPPTPELPQVTPSVPQPPEMMSPHAEQEEEEEPLEGVTVVKDVNEYLRNYSGHPKVHSPTFNQSPPSYLLQTPPSHIFTMDSDSGVPMGTNCAPLLLNPDAIDTASGPYNSPQVPPYEPDRRSLEIIDSIYHQPGLKHPYRIPKRKFTPSSDEPSTSKDTTFSSRSPLTHPDEASTQDPSYQQSFSNSSLWNRVTHPLNRADQKLLWKQIKRSEPEYRANEQQQDTLRRQQKRKNPVVKQQEVEAKQLKRSLPGELDKERKAKQDKRAKPGVLQKEKKAKQDRRSKPGVLQKERDAMRDHRAKPGVLQKEQEAKQDKRSKPGVLQKERDAMRDHRAKPGVLQKEKEAKQDKRSKPGVLQKERDAMRDHRAKPGVLQKEKEAKQDHRAKPGVLQKEKEAKQDHRAKPGVLQKENEAKQDHRAKPGVLQKEKEAKQDHRAKPGVLQKEKEAKQDHRAKPGVLQKEKEAKQDHRAKPGVLQKEKEAKQDHRAQPGVLQKEKEAKQDHRAKPGVLQKEKKAKQDKRSKPGVLEVEKVAKRTERMNKKPKDLDSLIVNFHGKIKEGPVFVCTCCNQLTYKHSVQQANKENIKTYSKKAEDLAIKCFTGRKSVNDKEWICKTCFRYVKKGKMPPSAVANKMVFTEQGPLKDLNPLELTLLSPLLPFMKIHQAPTGKQFKIHGNMVVVPADTINTVQSLPRLSSDTSTIKAQLKRRLRYQHHVYSLNIRPEKIRIAAKYLSETGELYKSLNITYDLGWSDTQENTTDDTSFDVFDSSSAPSANDSITPDDGDDGQTAQIDSDDEWNEVDENDTVAGVTDTLLTPPDFIESGERDMVYSYAPSENRKPVSIFTEKTSEEQAYPGIFCGQSRVSNEKRTVPVTYGEIVKSELRNSDRRCAKNVENIFFKTKKLQMKFLIDQTNIALRKIKTGGQQLTAKDVRKENAQNLIHLDQGYKVLRTLRGSPPYFQAVSKELFASIRQLGPATFFLTLSAAETHWNHLLRILGNLIDNKNYTDEEVENFTWQDKTRLIQSDPVTCTRHFDFSLHIFMNQFLLSNLNPIGKVTDWFYRIEFQQRGSPHVHMMLWCADAPNINENSYDDICNYIDKYITCSLPTDDDDLKNLVKLQTHKHSRTCKGKKKKQCRFGFPKPPMNKTQILMPFDADKDAEEKTKYQNMWKRIHEELVSMSDGADMSHKDFLKMMNITEDDYIMAIRTSISTATVFLRRSPLEIRVNNYNPHCLKAWRANLDLQFILDVYACAIYIASYVTKAQRGMSELLRNACKEANAGNKTIKEQVRLIGNKFLNAVEISAQEACYLSLQLPLKKSSRQTIFINTSPPDQRVVLLKPQDQLNNLDDEDEEIECKGLLARYSERPKRMENVTLAEFGSFYERKKSVFTPRAKSICKTTRDGLIPDPQAVSDAETDDPSTDVEDGEQSQQATEDVEYRKRQKPKIIRTVHFNPSTDPENYHRELLMLYSPWRDEQKDLLGKHSSFTARYNKISAKIKEQQQIFEPFREEVQSAEILIAEQPDLEDAWDTVAPNTQQRDEQERELSESNRSGMPNQEYDIGPELGLPVSVAEDMNSYNQWTEGQLRKHMRSLNKQQIEFIYDILHQLKTTTKPVYHFLSGGAGVGKSFVTKALYQMILKYYNRKAGDDFTTPRVLLMAPTGKAAYHIHGNTIHSTLRIPANQKLQHKSLDSSSFNTLQNTIGNAKLIFIDEISMVGYKMLNCIHQRLMEVKRSKEPFGGISIIAVGDLFQLKPVMDSYIFKMPKTDYMPLATNLWKELFKMTELTDIMRQKDNKEFSELLNRLREGNHTTEDILLLKTNLIDQDDDDYPYETPHVFISNEKVNSYNSSIFLRTGSTKYTVKSKDRVVGSCNQEAAKKILEAFASKTKDVPQLPTTVQLAEELTYELTLNLDCEDGLINGASCKIKRIKLSHPTDASGIIWVLFYDKDTGNLLRKSKKRLFTHDIDKDWTPIEPTMRQYSAGYKGETQVQRLQFPLRPSAAKTIHRSQGDTVDDIVVDLTSNRKIDHIHYVALSRVTSMKGLKIRNLQEDKISVNKEVEEEMKLLRLATPQPSLQLLYNIPDKLKIVFLNANSLNKHLVDVKADFSLNAADVLSFSETRFHQADKDTKIKNFYTYRQDAKAEKKHERSPYGMAIYSKMELADTPRNLNFNTAKKSTDKTKTIEMMMIELPNKTQNVTVLFLYKPPSVQVVDFINHLRNVYKKHLIGKNCIVLGDFNIDWSTQSADRSKLSAFFQTVSFHQLVKTPTTEDDTMIDLIFTNLEDTNIQSGTLEVFFSPHKPVWVALE